MAGPQLKTRDNPCTSLSRHWSIHNGLFQSPDSCWLASLATPWSQRRVEIENTRIREGLSEARVMVPEMILPRTSFSLSLSQHIQVSLVRFRSPRQEAHTRFNLYIPRAQSFPYLLPDTFPIISRISERAYISRSTPIMNTYLLALCELPRPNCCIDDRV